MNVAYNSVDNLWAIMKTTVLLSVLSMISISSSQILPGIMERQLDFNSRLSMFGKSQSLIVSMVESKKQIHSILMNNESLRSNLISSECWQNSLQYLKWITEMLQENHSTTIPNWAYEMVDGTAKIPPSIQNGNVKWLGSFSECLKIRSVPDGVNQTEQFRGRYCLGGFNIKESDNDSGKTLRKTYQFVGQVHGVLRFQDAMGHAMPIIFGLCWPSSCSGNEISEMILILGSLTNFKAELIIDPATCQIDETKHFDGPTITAITVLSFSAALVIISTVIEILIIYINRDSDKKKEPFGENLACEIITCFSLYKNGKKILQISGTNQDDALNCTHGIRLLSCLWIIFFHLNISLSAATQWTNYYILADIIKQLGFDFINKGTFSVDTFLVLSGFFVMYGTIKKLKKTKGHFNIFKYYLHRYLRLTPLTAMMIVFISGPFLAMGTGPTWTHGVAATWQEKCRDYWWRNLLYINTYYNHYDLCHGVTWYQSVDMTFYVLSPLIIYPLYKKPIMGYIMLAIFFFTSIFTTGLLIYIYDIPGFENYEFMTIYPKEAGFGYLIYTKPWSRMGSYLVGMLLAYYLDKKNMNVKLNQVVLLTGWLLCTALGLTLLFGTHYQLTGELHTSNTLNIVYGVLSRPAWGLVIAWIIFACATGQGGPINAVLSWRGFIPLSRLTYSTYQIHFAILILYFHTQEQPIFLSTSLVMILFVGLTVISITVAFFASMAFEQSVMNLETLLLPKLTGHQKVPTKSPPTTKPEYDTKVSPEKKDPQGIQ